MDEIKRDEIESKVKELTLDLDINYNSLNTKTKKHLINIEHSISNRETKYLELKNKLQGNKITLTSISEDAGIKSRQTIYNNPELKAYVDARMRQANELNPYHLVDDLRAKIADIQEMYDKMVERDIDTEILRYEVSKLKNDILNRDEEILRMQDQADELKSRIKELKKTTSNSNSKATTSNANVVTFSKK